MYITNLLFGTLIGVNISKNCSDHFCQIDQINKMTLLDIPNVTTFQCWISSMLKRDQENNYKS